MHRTVWYINCLSCSAKWYFTYKACVWFKDCTTNNVIITGHASASTGQTSVWGELCCIPDRRNVPQINRPPGETTLETFVTTSVSHPCPKLNTLTDISHLCQYTRCEPCSTSAEIDSHHLNMFLIRYNHKYSAKNLRYGLEQNFCSYCRTVRFY